MRWAAQYTDNCHKVQCNIWNSKIIKTHKEHENVTQIKKHAQFMFTCTIHYFDICEASCLLFDIWVSLILLIDNESPATDQTTCKIETTQWSSCSQSCGVGVSIRMTGDEECQPLQERRLCIVRPCDLSLEHRQQVLTTLHFNSFLPVFTAVASSLLPEIIFL